MSQHESYLDISKSVIISSPAGSGKTEKLSRRYISLLEGGAAVEKILCITFTEKAAAEMKERILSILEREKPEFLKELMPKAPLMRISTIHSFCLKVLKRFSIELGLDPSLSVTDEFTAGNLWNESLYEGLMEERNNPGGFFRMIRDRGLRGWGTVKRRLDELHARTPYPEIFIREGGLHSVEGDALSLMELYASCLERYRKKKQERHILDFNDLEMLAFEALSLGHEAHNILYAFDEHTDHLLVDEFQDTSTLQWKIIDKLTEEWRSGYGAKREGGTTPTIFLVGDEKQSIYLFRGANVSLFKEARERLAAWLGPEYHFVEVKDNYRSLPAITGFTNSLFEHLMPPTLTQWWKTSYSPFEAARSEGEGRVELLLLDAGESTQETRIREARMLAKQIRSLADSFEVYENKEKRRCRYQDMAILLKRRTHLGLFEDALRDEGVPFVVLKGIGFYEEPETALLREVISFVIDPADVHSLFCILRSPLFAMDYKTLSGIFRGNTPPFEKLAASDRKKLNEAYATLASWIGQSPDTRLSVMLENILLQTGGWVHFHEKQRQANLRKFIAMVESMESDGLSPVEIREKLLRQRFARDEAKANINAEGVDAVRIMTVHAAKGLQFPMVFLPSMDEPMSARSGAVVFDDSEGRVAMGYEEDYQKKKKLDIFNRQKEKLEEEEKRLFYVAVTRAMDYLCMVGSHNPEKKTSGRLKYLDDSYEMLHGKRDDLPFHIITPEDIEKCIGSSTPKLGEASAFINLPEYTEPLDHTPLKQWRDVTEDTLQHDIRRSRSHGEHWTMLGTVLHSLFEQLSKGVIKEEQVEEHAERMLRGAFPDYRRELDIVLGDIEKLRRSPAMRDIILPSTEIGSYTELPFVLEKDGIVFRGRIDRLLIRNGEVHVYDYKTFPVDEKEIPFLLKDYSHQMGIYAEAAEKLFDKKAKAFLVFTHLPQVEEITAS